MKTKIYSLLLLLVGLLPGNISAQTPGTNFNYTDAEGTVWKCQVLTATTASIGDLDGAASPMFSIVGSYGPYPVNTGDTRNYKGDVLHLHVRR